MVHSDSNIPRNLVKALPEVGVQYMPGQGLGQTFPADPHYALGPAKSDRLSPPPADPTHHQVVISGQWSLQSRRESSPCQGDGFQSPRSRPPAQAQAPSLSAR
ncbi:hypothetical protein CHARACLAT_019715 [Characodon lateralis]|uniref:Uncharacterized protein n=1 Tax=Characodon lateralis TaxID=208331 RepID=A0ABU7DT70_9TELE|nr:hypothetical protein [Characodon lateralis]